MAHPRVRQLHQHLAGPGRGRVERGDGGADAAGVVVDAGLVLLRDGDVGGGHCLGGGGWRVGGNWGGCLIGKGGGGGKLWRWGKDG